MKCEYCAGNLSIEDLRCPHCNAENPYYKAHREDMANYEKRFNMTQQNVMEKTRKVTNKAIYITIIAILSTLLVAGFFIIVNLDDFLYNREYAKNSAKASVYAEEFRELERAGEYSEMGYKYSSLYINTYKTAMAEFDRVLPVCTSFNTISNYLEQVATDRRKYLKPNDLANYVSRQITVIADTRYTNFDESKRMYPEKYSDEHVQTMDNIIEDLNVLFKVYLNMSDEDIESMWTMTETKRGALLEDYFVEVMSDEEE